MSAFAAQTLRSRAEGRKRYGVLMVAILAAFFVQGVANPGRWEQLIVAVLLGVTLIAALRAAEVRPIVLRVAVVVVAAVVAAAAAAAASGSIDSAATRFANALLVLLAPPAIAVGVVRNLRARQAVTIEAVFGVLCLYLLVGMFFAYIYGGIDRVGGTPFFAGGESATTARCLYYSFTTLTTIGYGDLTASSNLGHTLSVLEGLLGQIYLVTVVSLIVGNLGRGRRSFSNEAAVSVRSHGSDTVEGQD
jgi:Ion channel